MGPRSALPHGRAMEANWSLRWIFRSSDVVMVACARRSTRSVLRSLVALSGGSSIVRAMPSMWVSALHHSTHKEVVHVDFEEGQEFGLCWVRAVGRYVIPVDIHHDVFHGVLREGDVVGDVFVGDVPGGFGGCAEKWRALPPSHLEGVGDDEFDVGKVPGVIRVDDYPPVAILEIDFGEHERYAGVWR